MSGQIIRKNPALDGKGFILLPGRVNDISAGTNVYITKDKLGPGHDEIAATTGVNGQDDALRAAYGDFIGSAWNVPPVLKLLVILAHINDKTTNCHGVTKEQVQLGKCDNTADKDKPLSDPVKLILDAMNTDIGKRALQTALEALATKEATDIDALQKALAALGTIVAKKADDNNVVHSIGGHKDIANLLPGNLNIDIVWDEEKKAFMFSPKGNAGGVTSLQGLVRDIVIESPDGTINISIDREHNKILVTAKGGAGTVKSVATITPDTSGDVPQDKLISALGIDKKEDKLPAEADEYKFLRNGKDGKHNWEKLSDFETVNGTENSATIDLTIKDKKVKAELKHTIKHDHGDDNNGGNIPVSSINGFDQAVYYRFDNKLTGYNNDGTTKPYYESIDNITQNGRYYVRQSGLPSGDNGFIEHTQGTVKDKKWSVQHYYTGYPNTAGLWQRQQDADGTWKAWVKLSGGGEGKGAIKKVINITRKAAIKKGDSFSITGLDKSAIPRELPLEVMECKAATNEEHVLDDYDDFSQRYFYMNDSVMFDGGLQIRQEYIQPFSRPTEGANYVWSPLGYRNGRFLGCSNEDSLVTWWACDGIQEPCKINYFHDSEKNLNNTPLVQYNQQFHSVRCIGMSTSTNAGEFEHIFCPSDQIIGDFSYTFGNVYADMIDMFNSIGSPYGYIKFGVGNWYNDKNDWYEHACYSDSNDTIKANQCWIRKRGLLETWVRGTFDNGKNDFEMFPWDKNNLRQPSPKMDITISRRRGFVSYQIDMKDSEGKIVKSWTNTPFEYTGNCGVYIIFNYVAQGGRNIDLDKSMESRGFNFTNPCKTFDLPRRLLVWDNDIFATTGYERNNIMNYTKVGENWVGKTDDEKVKFIADHGVRYNHRANALRPTVGSTAPNYNVWVAESSADGTSCLMYQKGGITWEGAKLAGLVFMREPYTTHNAYADFVGFSSKLYLSPDGNKYHGWCISYDGGKKWFTWDNAKAGENKWVELTFSSVTVPTFDDWMTLKGKCKDAIVNITAKEWEMLCPADYMDKVWFGFGFELSSVYADCTLRQLKGKEVSQEHWKYFEDSAYDIDVDSNDGTSKLTFMRDVPNGFAWNFPVMDTSFYEDKVIPEGENSVDVSYLFKGSETNDAVIALKKKPSFWKRLFRRG